MRYTLPDAERAAAYPRVLVEPLENLSGTALVLYRALQATAQRTGAARGYVDSTTHVTVHLPVEIVGLSLGKHRVTVWRAAKQLRALGLIDARPHKTTALNGRTVNSGTLWAVRLDPEQGAPAKLTYEEMKHAWRDLDRDRRRGRTAYKVAQDRMQQSKELPTEGFDLELLLAWSIPPGTQQNPVTHDCCTGARLDLEAVLDVQHVDKHDRREAVNAAAQALAVSLRDSSGLNFYRWLIWQLLRLQDAGLDTPWYEVYLQAQRARADAREGFARSGNGGALFTARLKRSPWWDELQRASGRVGTRPAPPVKNENKPN